MSAAHLVPATFAIAFTLSAGLAAQSATAKKADVVSVSGCLTAGPNDTWLLTSATDPTVVQKKPPPAAADAPGAPGAPTTGKNKYRLIGLIEFDVAAHKGHTVAVKGLLIPASDVRRINLTSLQDVAPTCPPAKP